MIAEHDTPMDCASSREQQFLDIFQKVSRLTSMAFDHQQIMDTIVRGLPGLLDIDACTIRLFDPSTAIPLLGAAHGVSLEYLSREVVDSEQTMAMIRSGHPVFSGHVDEDPHLPFQQAARREGIKCVLSLPILFQGDLTGILRLLTRSERSFTAVEISFAMALAEQVGIAIAHGRMFKEVETQLNFNREIQAISTLVNSTLDLEVILKSLVERAAITMGVKGCTLRLLDPAGKNLDLAASFGVSAEYLQRGDIAQERSMQMVLGGAPVSIYDVRHDQRIDYPLEMAAEGLVSLLAVPLKVHGEIIGVLRILADTPRVFTQAEVQFAVTMAEVGGAAIRNARNYSRVNQLLNRIKEHEHFLGDIINSLHHQLLVLDPDRRVVLANRAFLESIGLSEADVLGSQYGQFCTTGATGNLCPVDQILQGQRMEPFVQEFRDNDEQRWLERTAAPIYDRRGEIAYVLEIIRDITSSHLLAEEKMQSGKLQGIVELAGTVAHEINSPLFAALGTAQLLADDCTQAEMSAELEVIIRNLRQIGELTEKMTSMTGYSSRAYVGMTTILSLNEKKDNTVDGNLNP